MIIQSREDIVRISKPKNGYVCGIYFLIKHSAIVYIGKSVNIEKRIKQHKQNGAYDFDSYSIIEYDESSPFTLSAMEEAYIRHFEPKYNKKIKAEAIAKVRISPRKLC